MKVRIKTINRYLSDIILIGNFVFTVSCVTSFVPNFKGETGYLVVDGSLIKGLDTQVIKITRSADINYPEYQSPKCPLVENCQVKIKDKSGNEFDFTETSAGRYIAVIDDALLNYNTQYKLEFRTPAGESYESNYQSIVKTAPIDTVYSTAEYSYNQQLNDNSTFGYQFYIDLNAPDNASLYYLWLVENTWEVHSSFKIFGYYDGEKVIMGDNPSDSLFHCWKTKSQTGIFTTSTTSLLHNIVKKIPLHYLSGSSLSMLGVLYCATVRQYALDKEAYEYWHEKEVEMSESGQIYTTQPGQLKSNIINTQNPDEKILGYFWASSCSMRRLFMGPGEKGISPDVNPCRYFSVSSDLLDEGLEKMLLLYITNYKTKNSNFPKPPVYIYQVCSLFGCIYYITLSNDCIDCRLQNATLQKPYFWNW